MSRVWTGPQLHWHITCLELLAVYLALNHLRGRFRGQARAGPHGRHCDRCVHQPTRWSMLPSHIACHLLFWSQKHLRSIHAIHIPSLHNRAAYKLSQAALPGEWRLHPKMVQLIWRRFGATQVDLFASPETSHCQLFYSLTEGTLGTDTLAHICGSMSFPQ